MSKTTETVKTETVEETMPVADTATTTKTVEVKKEPTWYEQFLGKQVKKEVAHGDSVQQIEAEAVVRNYMLWTGAAGIIPVPVVDIAAISSLQLAMLYKITKIYEAQTGVKFTNEWGKEVIGSLTGGLAATSLGNALGKNVLKTIPFIGGIASAIVVPGFAAASTWALGQVFITHFESGGTILDFDPVKVKHYYESLVSKKSEQPA